MATKIITLRLPRSTYDALATAAAIAGLPLSVYVRGKIDRAEVSATLETLIEEVRKCASTPPAAVQHTPSREREILLLVRTVAAHLNPQIPSAVSAKLLAEAAARK